MFSWDRIHEKGEFDRAIADFFGKIGLSEYPEDGNYGFSATGEAFWTVTSGGIKFETARDAFCRYLRVIRAIMRDFSSEGVIYWRKRPELRYNDGSDGLEPGWSVTSRLLISKRPVIQAARVPDDPLEVDYENPQGGSWTMIYGKGRVVVKLHGSFFDCFEQNAESACKALRRGLERYRNYLYFGGKAEN